MTDGSDLGRKYADAMFAPRDLTPKDQEMIAALLADPVELRAYGVRFLSDGSVAHPWNGRTQKQRARERLAELRATYPRDRFALVIRDGPDQPWREVDE